MTACGMVVPFSEIGCMLFLAISIPFLMAIGTSFALPEPYPTRPCPSPTTTSAENEKFLPPLTTLVTRLMYTTRSMSSRPCASRSFSRSRGALGPRLLLMSCLSFLELETGLPRTLGEGLHAAVVPIPAAVEDDLLDARLLRALGHQPADLAGRVAVRSLAGRVLAKTRVERGGVRERRAVSVVDDLG